MNTTILMVTALLTQQTSAPNPVRIERATPAFMAALQDPESPWGPVMRGQNPTYDANPVTPPIDGGGFAPQAAPNQVFQQGPTDPFLNGGGVPPGMTDPYDSSSFSYGVNGPQPYRMGWSSSFAGGYIWPSDLKNAPPGAGTFTVTEEDVRLQYNTAGPNGWIWSFSPELDVRQWEGPSLVGLPGTVYNVGTDFQLSSPTMNGFTVQGGFTPHVGSDFANTLNSQAWMFDGRLVMYYRMSPEWMLVGGVLYWDRVQDLWIPTGGVVWNPGDRWEFRLTYPKARASVFLGNWVGLDTWLYASGEYHVEAYQVGLYKTSSKDQIQISDYRLMVGLRGDTCGFTSFVEGGWVIDRDAIFAGNTPDFRIDNGYMVRAGIQF
ncbi:MAG: hypothetical protein U0903_22325 [Planctomycetales bacterium]